MLNSLTYSAGLQLGPIALEALLKHYFDRVKKEEAAPDLPFTQLRQDELLYDEAFTVVKARFCIHSKLSCIIPSKKSKHSPTPGFHLLPGCTLNGLLYPHPVAMRRPPFSYRLLGERSMYLVSWRISGEWVTARKDWEDAKKHRGASGEKRGGNSDSSQDRTDMLPTSISDPIDTNGQNVRDLRCILYAHGGGYYFGSLDLERFCIQRLARKIKGRAFAINYRLAPQYPFPCALQDLVAAYLYLIKPPPEATHQPINSSHIVVAGDSAGGGLILALLQVLRDTGLPLPAGGVLISPWCDLTHSFPSVHTNTTTDVIPLYGLSFHKPSALWPPPSEEMTHRIRTSIRRKIRHIVRVTNRNKAGEGAVPELTQDALCGSKLRLSGDDGKSSDMPIDVGATAALPSVDEKDHQTVSLQTKSGEQLKIDSQIHFYTQNSLLGHPLVSPALSYLGGLPPLFIIASEKEVLRDEIIYSAHKAVDPSKFPPSDEARALYPPLVGIGDRYRPTQVHLQVYDDAAHVLPVLFPFTTPAKYCYRAIAAFTKHVTGILNPMELTSSSTDVATSTPPRMVSSPMSEDLPSPAPAQKGFCSFSNDLSVSESPGTQVGSPSTPAATSSSIISGPSFSPPPFFSFQRKPVPTSMSRSVSEQSLRGGGSRSQNGKIVGNSSKLRRSASMITTPGVRYAGEASVYYDDEGRPTWREGMIRERVSTQGVIRPLEPVDRIDALRVPSAIIGVLSERAVRRYLEGKTIFDQKYAKELLAVEKHRNRNIDLAKKDSTRNLTQLQESQNGRAPVKRNETSRSFIDNLESSTGTWGWAWADERPPPSSIISRRDTNEARRLARIADQSILQDELQTTNNKFWSFIVKFLITSPSREHPASDSEVVNPPTGEAAIKKKSKSAFVSFRLRERRTVN
ncbi:hypothetical protein JVU11DRAFT_7489 [Chiua virens]|nr:hypothetical protein JVU11DRAFT_7489 [Chiua virens]